MKDGNIKRHLLSIWDAAHNIIHLHYVRKNFSISVMTSRETVAYIKKHHCSIARYGDGELELMLRRGAPGFQNGSEELASALQRVLEYNSPNLLICMPAALVSTKGFKKEGKRFWEGWAIANQEATVTVIRQIVGKEYRFGDTNLSRPFSAYKKPKNARKMFPLLKELWERRDLLIVEGDKTRLGIGNNLFSNARSIRRILAPAENAFASYDKILNTVLANWQNELVILALGPTATILAADLSLHNIQALDLGHIDIQYEWYLRNDIDFHPVPGKYTNEAIGGQDVGPCEDIGYLSQIVATIQ